MSMTLTGALARGALIGAGIGGFMGYATPRNSPSRGMVGAGILTGIALGALGFYVGSTAVICSLIGMVILGSSGQLFEGAIFGAIVGYGLSLAAI